MHDRQVWVDNNHDLIKRVATDPISNLPEWEAADEPWQFLAACEEYYACVINCNRQFTNLMVARCYLLRFTNLGRTCTRQINCKVGQCCPW